MPRPWQRSTPREVGALLADDTILRNLMARYPGRYRLLAQNRGSEVYAAAVTQGSSDLLDIVDVALREFKVSGNWAASYAKYIGGPVLEPPVSPARTVVPGGSDIARGATQRMSASEEPLPLARLGTALRRIQDRGYLVVAVREDMPGFGYRDPTTGEYSGLEIDLARAIAMRIFGTANIEYLPAATRQRIPALRSALRLLNPLVKDISTLSATLASSWWHLGIAGRLPEFLCPKECVGQHDYVGLDYYWGIPTLRLNRIQALIDSALGRYDRAPVWPTGLYGYLKYLAGLFPGLSLLILENGSVDVADGIERPDFLRRHIEEAQRAVRDGVNLLGYICWSITSNREWGLAFNKSSDFGLYHIDLDKDPELRRVSDPIRDGIPGDYWPAGYSGG